MDASNNKFLLSSLLEMDIKNKSADLDEKLSSTIYLTSLCTSLKKLSSIKEKSPQESVKKENENNWPLGEEKTAMNIPVINFDRLPQLCNFDMLKSFDALILDYNKDKLNYIIEFKRCSRDVLIRNYLKPKSDDNIQNKLKNSQQLISKKLYIEGTPDFCIKKTHVIIVYHGKNNTISEFNMTYPCKEEITPKGSNQKQNKASYSYNNRKNSPNSILNLPYMDDLDQIIKKLEFAKCNKGYFPIPCAPKYKSSKHEEKSRSFSIFSSYDFIELLENHKFFQSVDWGIYKKYLPAPIENTPQP